MAMLISGSGVLTIQSCPIYVIVFYLDGKGGGRVASTEYNEFKKTLKETSIESILGKKTTVRPTRPSKFCIPQ